MIRMSCILWQSKFFRSSVGRERAIVQSPKYFLQQFTAEEFLVHFWARCFNVENVFE